MPARILTVDDSASIRMTTKIALSGAGYTITDGCGRRRWLGEGQGRRVRPRGHRSQHARDERLTMIKELRRLPAHMGIPIIFLTTESDADLKARAKAAGATGWLTKPFDPENLVKIVRKVFGR